MRARLVVVEPGVSSPLEPAEAADHNHVLLFAADESPSDFHARLRQRVSTVGRSPHQLSDVTYLVGQHREANWTVRRRLLADLCEVLQADGRVAVVAPQSDASDVLGCLGDLQAARAAGPSMRAIFTPAGVAAQDGAP